MSEDLSNFNFKADLHRFELDGWKIVLDVNSGAVHIVDDVVWEILQAWEEGREVVGVARETYREALNELDQLQAEGLLFSERALVTAREDRVVKALCLHLAHDCNLRCQYCFAATGSFGGDRGLMNQEVGRAAVDFLIRAAGSRRHVEIDFFGGEPLLNLPVLRDVIGYGRDKAREAGKEIKFTVTTNGLLLDQQIGAELNREGLSAVLSLDGRPEVHDRLRRTANGAGSFAQVYPRIKSFLEGREFKDYYVRGTFTLHNLDFARDVAYLADCGFKEISVEPVVAAATADYALIPADLPALQAEYEVLTRELWQRYQAGYPINFFHFNIDLNRGPCLAKRISGCGAGAAYLAVAPSGKLYPCHQFVGQEDYLLGDVWHGICRPELVDNFRHANIYTEEGCLECWARYYCGGGCYANALAANGDIHQPAGLGCDLHRKRVECALYLKARQAGISPNLAGEVGGEG